MAYDPIVLRRATARLEGARRARQEELDRRRRDLFQRIPELADIDRQLRHTTLDIIRSCLKKGTDPTPALNVIRDKNMSLQARQAQLLLQEGLPDNALDDSPICPICRDTGWDKTGKMCNCLRTLYAQEQVKELSKLLDLGEQSFDSFSLDWYSPLPWPGKGESPRDNMEFVQEFCLNYARRFGKFMSNNLFLTGSPGLGKTFLSACIARTVAENGFSVVYDTAVNIFARFEEQKFSRDAEEGREASGETRRYLSCDLLILDDLGSEMTTPFVQSALYTLVNTRLVRNKHTVISSNLSINDIRARYAPQTASRLEGEYKTLEFFGEDIRLKRKSMSFPAGRP